ncbi:MAG: M48 family metalloprotease [Sedimentisphaerales bacterium]|nr:M48 family metalloprotease [Sedimentisphaerales bacterium]
MFRLMNNVRTAILLAGLMALFLYIGSFWGQGGIIIALLLGGTMNMVAYFFSDKIAIASMRARPVTEAQAPQLYSIVRELSQKANLPMPRIYICPQSAPNAFATGRNPRNAAVAVTEGLLHILDRNELMGVLGHELAHVKHRDILISCIAATIAGAISALGYLLWFVPMGDNRRGNPLAAIALIILAPIAAALIQMAISRKREYNADSFGAELAGDPMYLATALEKLHLQNQRIPMPVPIESQKNMFIVQPFSGKDAGDLFNTHPSLEKRLIALIGKPSTGRF